MLSNYETAMKIVKDAYNAGSSIDTTNRYAETVGRLQFTISQLLAEKQKAEVSLKNPEELLRRLEQVAKVEHANWLAETLYQLIEKNEEQNEYLEDAKALVGQALTLIERGLNEIDEKHSSED